MRRTAQAAAHFELPAQAALGHLRAETTAIFQQLSASLTQLLSALFTTPGCVCRCVHCRPPAARPGDVRDGPSANGVCSDFGILLSRI